MKKYFTHIFHTLLCVSFFFIFPFVRVFGEVHPIPELTNTVNNITDTIVWIVASLLVLFILSYGIQFLLHADNPQERHRLKMKVIWSLIGLFIILTARPLSTWIQTIIT